MRTKQFKFALITFLLASFFAPLTASCQISPIQMLQESSPIQDDLFSYDSVYFEWSMPGKVQAHLNEGINQLQENNVAVAIGSLDEALNLDERLWMAHYYRGVCYKLSGNWKLAEKDFERTLKLNDEIPVVYLELGKVNQLQMKFQEAENNFQKFIRTNPNDVRGYYLLGNLLFQMGELSKAKKQYEKCNQLNPNFPDSFVKNGILQISQERNLTAGIGLFEKALVINPNHQQALLFHSLALIEKDPTKSLQDLSRLITIHPANINYRIMRGYLLVKQQEYEKAFRDFQFGINQMQQNPNQFRGGQTLLDKQIDLQYAGYYTMANIYGLPDETAFHVKKGFCFLLTGEYKNAIHSFNEARVNDESALTLFLTAVASEHLGLHDEAYTKYDMALKVDNKILDAHKKRGVYRSELNNLPGAIDDFTMMLEIEPRAIIAYKFRGITYFNTDEFNNAKSDFSKYLENDTTDNETYVYRGMTYKILNEPYLAANDFLQGNQPDSVSKFNPDELVLSLLKSRGASIARTEAIRLAQRFPQYPTPHIILIKILEYNNDWTSISNKIDDAIEVVSLYRSESINHSYLLTIKAKQQLKDGNRSEAVSTLTNAIRINVKNGNAYFERAKLYLTMNKINNAKQDLIMAKSLGVVEAEKILIENSK